MKLIRWLSFLSLGLFFAFPVFAQTPLPEILSTQCRVEGNCDIAEFYNLIARSANFMLAIVGALLLIMFVYGGFWLIISGGNAERVAKAKSVFVGSVIGLILVFGGYTIVNGVLGTIVRGDVSSPNEVQNRDSIQKALDEQAKFLAETGCCSINEGGYYSCIQSTTREDCGSKNGSLMVGGVCGDPDEGGVSCVMPILGCCSFREGSTDSCLSSVTMQFCQSKTNGFFKNGGSCNIDGKCQ